MDWTDALELVVSRTQHEAYRKACDESHPRHEMWRRRMVEMAGGELPPEPTPGPPRYPSLMTQASNMLGAIKRAAAVVVAGKPLFLPAEEQARRTAICHACPRYDAAQDRCSACGCFGLKARLQSETGQCPEGKW